jgi:hypothetical protein
MCLSYLPSQSRVTIRLRLFEPDVDLRDRLLSKLAAAPIDVPELVRRNFSTGTNRPLTFLAIKSAARPWCSHSRPERAAEIMAWNSDPVGAS